MNYDLVITGATGFIGASFTKYFSQKGFKVLATGRSQNAPEELYKYAEYKSIDLAERIPSVKSKMCIHCAGLASEIASEEELMKVNLKATQELYKTIETDHFVHISSASVYPVSEKIHTEDEVIDNTQLSSYGFSKRSAEEWLEAQAGKKAKITIIRPRAVYGIGDRVLLPRILRLRKGPFIVRPGSLDYKISLTHIDNLKMATDAILLSDKSYRFNIYNVADSRSYRLSEAIAQLLEIAYQKKIQTLTLPPGLVITLGKLLGNPDINEKVMKYFLCDHQISNSKFCTDFETKLPHSLASYLPDLQEWLRASGIKKIIHNSSSLPWS